jgi:ElaB/YqjD/DUF883 family membrane-anchored ribosome-binding protein
METRFSSGMDTMESFTSTAKNLGGSVQELKSVISDLRERLGPYFTREKAKQVARQSADYAKAHPVPLIVGAVGLGLLVTWLVASRHGEDDYGTPEI